MKLPADLLERPAGESARLIVMKLLREGSAAAKRLSDPNDERALHDFRVAIRRTRAALESWSDQLPKKAKRLRKRLTALQRTTGAARDTEVALALFASMRAEAPPDVVQAIDWVSNALANAEGATLEPQALASEFEAVRASLDAKVRRMKIDLRADRPPPSYAELLADRVRERLAKLESLLAAVSGPHDDERLHRARIAGKRLRYLVEPIEGREPRAAEVVERMKQLQDLLGDLHDVHVLADRIADLCNGTDDAALRAAIASLEERVRSRANALFAELGRWDLEALRDLVHALARALEEHKSVEIERKYLLSGMPELPSGATSMEIEQGYLPGRRVRERVRRVTKSDGTIAWYRTIKLGVGAQRIEIEESCTPEMFEALWAITEGARVHKRRYLVEDGNLTWEIDQFLDRELVLAEVELPSADTEPEIPEWLASKLVEDVTDRREYTNLALAR